MRNIVFLDGATLNPGDLSWESLQTMGNFTVYDRTSPNQILERAANAEVLIVNKTQLTAAHFDHLPHLRLICIAATGYDGVDIRAARQHNVTVCNAAAYSTHSVAQMVVAMLLEVTNQVGHYTQLNRQRFWSNSPDFSRWTMPPIELVGKKVAVVGFGNIGRTVTEYLRPFGVQLYAVTTKPADQLPPDVTRISIQDAFASCDVISLNCPLTPENRGFVDVHLLDTANPRLILINTARGLLVDEESVATALTEGKLAAYCCDVLSQEPPSPTNPLLSAPHCFITPHIAWAAPEARQRILNILCTNIKGFFAGTPQNVVN